MNLINAKYGSEPGLKAYTHFSDQFGPFATRSIPATVNEAPYILDGLLMNEVGRNIKEQYADTGGFTGVDEWPRSTQTNVEHFWVLSLCAHAIICEMQPRKLLQCYLRIPQTSKI